MQSKGATAGLEDLNELLWVAVDEGATCLPDAQVNAALMRICASEICGVHKVSWPLSTATVEIWPDNRLADEMARMTTRHALAHPVLSHYLRTRDLRVLAPEDVDPSWPRHWVRSFIRSSVGVTEQVTVPIGFRDGVFTSFTLGRSGPAFGSTEREPLDRARALLVRADRILAARRGHSPETSDASASILTTRELEVVRRLATGATRTAVAHRLGISPRTVGKHVEHVNAKLGTGSLVETLHRLDLQH